MKIPIPRFPIRARLLSLVVVVLASILAFVAMELGRERRDAEAHAYGSAAVAARGVATRLDTKLDEVEVMLAALATRPWVQAMDPARCDPAASAILSLHPESRTLETRDTAGRAICTYPPRPAGGVEAAASAWFHEGLRLGTFMASDAVEYPTTGHWATVMTYPIHDARGGTVGLLVLTVELKALLGNVFSPLPQRMRAGVIDRGGRVLLQSHRHEDEVGKAIPVELFARTREPEGTFKGIGPDGTWRLYAQFPVGDSGWHAMAGLEERLLLEDFRERLAAILGLLLPIIAVVLAASFWVESHLAGPAADQARADVRVPGEIRKVATTDPAASRSRQ